MNNDTQTISIQLLNKSHQIRCSSDKSVALQKSAQYFDTKLREIASSFKTHNNENILIMAAIQAIHDLFTSQNQKDLYIESLSSHIRELQNKLSQHDQKTL
jgi:cell division protein ZapA (FtsZ GTPase activity inhibitor)